MLELADSAVDEYAVVQMVFGKSRRPFAKQPRHRVGPPARMAHVAAAKIGKSRHGERNGIAGMLDRGFDFRAQLWRYPLIVIQRQHPVACRAVQRTILLLTIAWKIRRLRDVGTEFDAYLARAIRAA